MRPVTMICSIRSLLRSRCREKFARSYEISARQMSTGVVQVEIPKYLPSRDLYKAPLQKHYKAIVVGGGHNGLVAAAYMAKSGMEYPRVTTDDRCSIFFQTAFIGSCIYSPSLHLLLHECISAICQ